MGDRNTVVFETREGQRLFFYTHWCGTEVPFRVQRALQDAKDRWEDPPYLARVVFCSMVGEDKDISGFGIDTEFIDNEHCVLVVRPEKLIVELHGIDANRVDFDHPLAAWSFEAFCALENITWDLIEQA